MVEEVVAEEGGLAVIVAAQPLDVRLDTDDEARTRRELVVSADLGAPDEAVAAAAAIATRKPERARRQRQRSNRRSARDRVNGYDTAEAAQAVVAVVVAPAVAGVHADIDAGPGEDRDGHEDRGSAPRKIRGHSSGGEAQKGYRGEQKLFNRRDPRCLMVVDHAFSKPIRSISLRFRQQVGKKRGAARSPGPRPG